MRPLVAMVLALGLVACGKPAELHADKAWIRLPAVPGRPAAAYLAITGGAEKATLLAVSTPVALRAELHESMAHGGMMSMAAIPQVDVAPGVTVTFAPGGKHVMLFDVAPTLKPGATAPLDLQFAEGRTLKVDAKVIGAGDPAP
ncbi:copper chaperone PCu(A)C [Sphingomonas sp.]|uniref:copper chaperone PCu(A)C n=1 Tax=Sphingomonas sp. TaxID=28214 RepID=UPI002BDA843F|nr:copper chaperone PCu(A)C [Sphingomonas sp.]HWK35045.1 copper chaperone PCu(A)C [Sphingomonas sp.]